jgi:ADP-ribosyl-[dinitrogen reductase] hydrolase
MIGSISGDIIGSVYKFSRKMPYDFEPLFHPGAKFTDDTIFALAVMESLLNNRAAQTSLHEWGRKYWSTGGWGKMFVQWLASSNPKPYGSFGNGAAMRIAPIG